MSQKLLYMAHPVSAPLALGIARNISRSKIFLRAFLMYRLPVIAPWIPHVEVMDDANAADRMHGLDVDIRTVMRCDGIVLCGEYLSEPSSGMCQEIDAIKLKDGDIVNCLGMSPTAASVYLRDWYIKQVGR